MLAPPMVTSTIPLNNEISVVYDQTLEANFNMPMDPLTINGTSFYYHMEIFRFQEQYHILV